MANYYETDDHKVELKHKRLDGEENNQMPWMRMITQEEKGLNGIYA